MRRLLLSTLAAAAIFSAAPASAEVVSHPPGCPHRAFCGCGVSLKVFGERIRELYLAANWRHFRETTARAGAVAWRWHHVMYIERMTGPNTAIVYDPNSGGHQTRVHERDLSGYRFVDPSSGGTHLSAKAKRQPHYALADSSPSDHAKGSF